MLNYYNKFADKFIEKTVELNMKIFYEKLEQYLLKGSSILDFGCGSRRDSKYFINRGYRTTSIDGFPSCF